MLSVTDTALEFVAQNLSESDVPDDVVMRNTVKDGSVAAELDSVRPDDMTFTHAERVVLAMDKQALELLGDMTLDVATDDDGPHLSLN